MNETIYAFLHMYNPVAIFAVGLTIRILCFYKKPNFAWKLPILQGRRMSAGTGGP